MGNMEDSDSEGNDDWSPSDMDLKPQSAPARPTAR